jgi:hypothetical protein
MTLGMETFVDQVQDSCDIANEPNVWSGKGVAREARERRKGVTRRREGRRGEKRVLG